MVGMAGVDQTRRRGWWAWDEEQRGVWGVCGGWGDGSTRSRGSKHMIMVIVNPHAYTAVCVGDLRMNPPPFCSVRGKLPDGFLTWHSGDYWGGGGG